MIIIDFFKDFETDFKSFQIRVQTNYETFFYHWDSLQSFPKTALLLALMF